MSSRPQQHYVKRQRWQKSYSASHAAPRTFGPRDLPPIAASTQSRMTLKAFQFIEGRPTKPQPEEDEDKENRPTSTINGQQVAPRPSQERGKIVQPPPDVRPAAQSPRREKPKPEQPADHAAPKVPGFIRSRTCPVTTPKTRLPIADLVGNAENASRCLARKNSSPEDQIYWQHVKSPSRVSSKSTTGVSKKRARSSSPVSGSQSDANPSGAKEALDVPEVARSVKTPLKTPRVDPAAEAWNHYATMVTPSAVKTPAFAHLLTDSSPHSPESAGSVNGLRRWASCGEQWPTSRAKRRKTSHPVQEGQTNGVLELRLQADPIGDDVDGLTISKVGLLVERIQETLPRTPQRIGLKEETSSSPLRGHDGDSGGATSPLQRLGPIGGPDSDDTLGTPEPEQGEPAQVQDDTAKLTTSSSDYGDDLDDDLQQVMDAMESGAETASTARDTHETDMLPVVAPPTAQNTVTEHSVHVAPEAQDSAEARSTEFFIDDDEFGDEEFAADMEELWAKLDNRAHDNQPQSHEETGPPDENRHVSHELESHTSAPVPTRLDDHSDDEFDSCGIGLEDFVAAETHATQVQQPAIATNIPANSLPSPSRHMSGSQAGGPSSSVARAKMIEQYKIKQVVEGSYTDERGGRFPEKTLSVKGETSRLKKTITLRQSWYDSPCEVGSLVHVVGRFTGPNECQCIINDRENMLILHPDHLLSATVVSDAFGCVRRAVLGDRVKATSGASASQMYGHILHELFQEAMKANRWDSTWLETAIRAILPRHFQSMVEINTNMLQVTDHLRERIPEIQGWANLFIRATPGPESVVDGRDGEKVRMSINKLLDVEEHVWAPAYGLKGNIDATVQIQMQHGTGTKTLTVPFELKTGRNTTNLSHRAQTALYTLLLSERYDVDVAYGLLYYMETSKMHRVAALRRDLIHIVMKRNEVACFARDRLTLPPVLENSHLCGRCFAQQQCFIYHKLLENGTDDHLEPKGDFNDLVRHLTGPDQEFFTTWDTLLTKEEVEAGKLKRELWTMMSGEREKVGRCFGNVVLESRYTEEHSDVNKINRYQYTFVKQHRTPGFSFTESQITVGEPIVVSDELGHFALANGYVTRVHRSRLTVAVDRRLHNARTRKAGFDAETNQQFAGIMEVARDGESPTPTARPGPPVIYRVDKDEFSNGMATVRNNLIQIMDNRVYKASDLRSLIIQNRAPTFRPPASGYRVPTQSSQMSMNPDQQAAIEKVMSAQDYALVLGMPGTGKTTTIAHIIRALVAKGKSVLLTSYTHTAVDNILLKIRHDRIGILRLGATAKVHPEVQHFAILGGNPTATLEELERSWSDPPVVATTCLGVNHPIFTQRVFDYCIVDEASQITLPVCLGPIRMARTFVLVGDHYQLPPLVQNKDAKDGGLDVSLFKLLSDRQPSAVINLATQYRMCADIMALANHLIYNGRLKCGTDAVARRALAVTDTSTSLASCHWPPPRSSHSSSYRPFMGPAPAAACPSPAHSGCWLARVLAPGMRVLFLDTDPLYPASHDEVSGPRIQNALEATLITHAAAALVGAGVPASDIGIVTFFRAQLSRLRRTLRECLPDHASSSGGSGAVDQIELHTADRFQGRDKEVVLISCVRSNSDGNVGDLLADWRRVNVALTRARSKLVIIGSAGTLARGDGTLKGLVELCKARGWCVSLPKGAAEAHWFGVDASQMTTQATNTAAEGGRAANGMSPGLKERAGPHKTRKTPEKVGNFSKRGIFSGRRVLKDIYNDVVGDI